MNIIYETTKERGATILMPSAMVESLNPAGALACALALKSAPGEPDAPGLSGRMPAAIQRSSP
jgi:hypothetical protein